jgi:microcystin-dependent protein
MAVDDVFVGQILLFPFNFAPQGYAMCKGQLMVISQNTALFSLLGTIYGGDGKSNFRLPDLQGRVPLKFGQGPGLSSYEQGVAGGAETVALSADQMPPHTHPIDVSQFSAAAKCTTSAATRMTPDGSIPAVDAGSAVTYSNTPNADMSPNAIAFGGMLTAGNTGASQPHDNLQPYLALNYCIALQGVFPARS